MQCRLHTPVEAEIERWVVVVPNLVQRADHNDDVLTNLRDSNPPSFRRSTRKYYC